MNQGVQDVETAAGKRKPVELNMARNQKPKWSADQPPPALSCNPHRYSYEQ
jgi:hypothetical protein